jgi:hypothetical protein
MHHYLLGHILIGWGFWLSGIAPFAAGALALLDTSP